MSVRCDPETHARAMVAISRARTCVLRRAPYFARALLRLRFAPAVGLNTFGITKRGLVYFDPVLVIGPDAWTVEEIAGVLVHELMHRLSRHAERADAFGVQDDEFMTWNEVCDAEINYKLERQFTLPDEPVYPTTLSLGLREEWIHDIKAYGYVDGDDKHVPILAEELMSRMRAQSAKAAPPPNIYGSTGKAGGTSGGTTKGKADDDADSDEQGDGAGSGDGQGDGSSSDDGSGDGSVSAAGAGDGGEGNVGSGSPQSGSDDDDETKDRPSVWEQCGSGVGAGCAGVDEDELEREFLDANGDSGLREHELKELIKDVARKVILQGSKDCTVGAGPSVPDGMRRWADEYKEKPKRLPWAKLLEKLARTLVECGGARNYSYNRPARRQATYGYGDDTPVMPSLRGHRPKIAIAVDVSGSVSDRDLDQMVAQLQTVIRSMRTKVSVCAFDHSLKGPKKVSNVMQARDILKGGGGTNVAPVFELYNKACHRPDVLIVMTDGCIYDAPVQKPPFEVVWCLVGDYRRQPSTKDYTKVTWGEVMEVENLHDSA